MDDELKEKIAHLDDDDIDEIVVFALSKQLDALVLEYTDELILSEKKWVLNRIRAIEDVLDLFKGEEYGKFKQMDWIG